MGNSRLLQKYDVPVPRYTSYPTVPYWTDSPSSQQWLEHLNKAFSGAQPSWSIYIHMPYCETLCTFCGCNTSITKNHDREEPYLRLIHKEWETYTKEVNGFFTHPLRQLHLGGGTPTFFSAAHLVELVKPILEGVNIDREKFDASIEVDPRRTSREQLQALAEIGFSRVSMGVQDFNPEVQKLVNRFQPLEITKKLTESARKLGYESVNFDLIYGLPRQSTASFVDTINKTIDLRPDRIALYSFAKVPWIKPQQRLFKDDDLPEGEAKRELYERARDMFLTAGYVEIGMDHFALGTDSLAKSLQSGELHRNFMGYTEFRTDVMLGLGVSSISEVPTCFHQNEKILPKYEKLVKAGKVPTLRGHLLSEEDRHRREQILSFMTLGRVELESDAQVSDVKEFLASLLADGLIRLEGRVLSLTDEGRPFMRNACVVFDERLRRQSPEKKIFSQAI